jgi:hypothetical protein
MKAVAFLLVGLVIFGVLVWVFYAISEPVLSIPVLRSIPAATVLVWVVIVGVPLVLTVQIMRMAYDTFRRRRR